MGRTNGQEKAGGECAGRATNAVILNLKHLVIVICFVLRASNFEFRVSYWVLFRISGFEFRISCESRFVRA